MNCSKMLSELIKELQDTYEEHGDMPVASSSNCEGVMSTRVYLETNPYYYDGGCIYPAEEAKYHCTKWKSSKFNPEEFGKSYLILASDCPDLGEGGDIVNGHKLPTCHSWKDDLDLQNKLNDIRTKFVEALKKGPSLTTTIKNIFVKD